MATANPVNLSGWYDHSPTSPYRDGNSPSSLRPSAPSSYTPSADSRLIYVSASGNDAGGAYTDIATQTDAFDPQGAVSPYLTLSAATAQMRSGFPDWILLKRGDIWTDQTLNGAPQLGRSASEPMMMTYYGASTNRPIVATGKSSVYSKNNVTQHITMYGIDAYCHKRDPTNGAYDATPTTPSGIGLIGTGDNITFDDCVFRFYQIGATIQGFSGLYNNVTLKRNIIVDNYPSNNVTHSQGSYIDKIDGLLIEENLFDLNGWNPDITAAEATIFNHGFYIQVDAVGANIVVRDNVITRSSANAMQFRPGGLCQDNLMIENSIGIGTGYGGFPYLAGTATSLVDNVILEGKDMDPLNIYSEDSAAVWGITASTDALDNGGTLNITTNIIAHRVGNGSNSAMQNDAGGTLTNNIIYDWNAGEDMSDGTWLAPERSIATYMTSIGGTATLDGFVDYYRNRTVGTWDANYTLNTVNNYFREGFNL